MKIKFNLAKHNSNQSVGQEVFYFYAKNSSINTSEKPKEQSYFDLLESTIGAEPDGLAILNYQSGVEWEKNILEACSGLSQMQTSDFSSMSIYKKEIWEDGEESILHPVVTNLIPGTLRDFNLANGRNYEYYIFPRYEEEERKGVHVFVKTNWQDWSLTELHPVLGEPKRFTAELSDVWIFKYNVEVGEQTQNITKTQQENLTAYPRFSRGASNNISSTVTALLGSEMLPFEFVLKEKYYDDGVWKEQPSFSTKGGYIERLKFIPRLTSNQAIDMLEAWRKVAFSGNPKLIKDRKGQKFIVQITSSSNTPQDAWQKKPDSITFNWVQIQGMDDVIITSPYN